MCPKNPARAAAATTKREFYFRTRAHPLTDPPPNGDGYAYFSARPCAYETP